jgi:hypothetical protein
MIYGRPTTEKDNEEQVANRYHVVRHSKCALEFPRPPSQASIIGFVDLARAKYRYGRVRIV